MKKSITILIIITMVLGLFGCGAKSSNTKTDSKSHQIKYYKVGQWINTKKNAESDNKPHSVKYRVTKIDRNKSSVEKAIEEYNLSAAGTTIPNLENQKFEYIIASYEIDYPKDFPDSEFGIMDVKMPFNIVSLEGKNVITMDNINYKGLYRTWQIGPTPQGYDFYSGSTYKGKIVYIMVKDFSDYLIEQSYKEGSKEIKTYVRGQ